MCDFADTLYFIFIYKSVVANEQAHNKDKKLIGQILWFSSINMLIDFKIQATLKNVYP